MHYQMLDCSARNNDAGAATVAPCETSPRSGGVYGSSSSVLVGPFENSSDSIH
jgi:hypothetical protein